MVSTTVSAAPVRLFLALYSVVGLLGCGGGPTAQVSGRVMYEDGSPIEGAVRVINFEPADDTDAEVRKAGSARLADDGSFEMMTRKQGDGVFKGKYHVTFTVLKDLQSGESLVPDEYTAKGDTPFSVEVRGDMTGLEYKLKKRN